MKHAIFLIVPIVLVFLFGSVMPLYADDQVMVVQQQQIQALQEEIKRLRALIATLKTQPQPQSRPQVLSESYLVMDILNNSVVLEKNAGQTYPIASVTKLMNAVVALENADINQTIVLTNDMLSPQGYSPSLFLNLQVSIKNLLRASLTQSVNDAAQAISYTVGNQKFLELMNQKARDLGMNNTYYYDVHGLNPKNHSTSADLAKLLTYVYNNHPEILAITKDNDFWLPDPTGRLLKFKNVNNFSQSPDFIGGKTGYLPEAKESFASLFKVNGKVMAIVLLRSPNRQKDTLKIIDWVKANAR